MPHPVLQALPSHVADWSADRNHVFSHTCTSHVFTHDSLCLIRFTLVQKHTVEFNQVAMANSEGSEAMLNRVMTKDNIGVAVVLEVHKELFGASEYNHGSLTDYSVPRKGMSYS